MIALRQKIKTQLINNAADIAVPISDYLYCTGRWAAPSLVAQCVPAQTILALQQKVANVLGKQVSLEKSNILCKNRDITDCVPLHQDMTYSPQAPYHYSLWLALNDVDEHAGPLHCIPASHHWPLRPAVDFWSPECRDKQLEEYQHPLQKIVLRKGDAVLFDSRLWHGSPPSISGQDRYAYVTRWIVHQQPFPPIPPIQPAYFGMWNCQQITEGLLKQGLVKYSKDIGEINDFIALLTAWRCLIKDSPLPFTLNKTAAMQDLHNVQILHQAANRHNAGDLTGRIYRQLWYSLLVPLQCIADPL